MTGFITFAVLMITSLAGPLDGVPLATPENAIGASEVCADAVQSLDGINTHLISHGWRQSTAAEIMGQKPDFPVEIFVIPDNPALIMRFPEEAPNSCVVGAQLVDRSAWDALLMQIAQLGTVVPDTLLPLEVRRENIRFNVTVPIIHDQAVGFTIFVSRAEG